MPATIPQAVNQLHDSEARWFAIYTHFKREKMVVRMLRQKGIECYLPLQRYTRRYTRKVRVVELPLISCYVFVRITREEYIRVLETEYVLKFIRFNRDLQAIPEREIELIRRVVGEGQPVEVDTADFNEGDEVEIIAGNLTGIRGTLVGRDGKHLFAVRLESLGYIMKMSIDPKLLRKTRAAVYR